jgi:membrane associated rhomboid family serine protease
MNMALMIRIVRRIGIAIGCLVAAWLSVSLVAGVFLGSGATGNALVGLITLVLGGLIYRDIIRRERRPA